MREYSRDASGHPVMSPSFVIFLDALGTSHWASDADAGRYLATLDHALVEARRHAEDSLEDPWYVSSWFSDNLAIASNIKTSSGEPELGALLNAAESVQLTLALEGIFTRGGLSHGLFFMDDNVTFGPVLVDAVRLEKAAVFPRIMLSEGVVDLVRTKYLTYYGAYPEGSPENRDLLVDVDGAVFVNYLDAVFNYTDDNIRDVDNMLEEHRDRIVLELRRWSESEHSVHAKYLWLAGYHNAFCARWDVEDLGVPDVPALEMAGIGEQDQPQTPRPDPGSRVVSNLGQ